MDNVKINKAIDGLGLSVDNKNTLKEALNQDYGADITEIETKVDAINKELGTLQNYTLPAATKTTLGGVKAITNIVNVDTETATAASLAGVVNTLLNRLRAAGIIQL